LQSLVENADRERRKRRKHQRRDIAALVPRPVIQPCERTVLDEMKPLDDINVRIARARGPRVEGASADGDREQAVSRRALLSDAQQRREDGEHNRDHDNPADDDSVLARRGVPGSRRESDRCKGA
jgi:hypothetical protein